MGGIERYNVRTSDPFPWIHLPIALRRIIVEICRNFDSENRYREHESSEDLSPCGSDIHIFPILSEDPYRLSTDSFLVRPLAIVGNGLK
jgi:hypothetical protein